MGRPIHLFLICVFLPAIAGCSIPQHHDSPEDPGPVIRWDHNTRRRVSSTATREAYNGYARMVQLPDGSLRCVYEADGRVVMVASGDLGGSWTEPVVVADREPQLCMAAPDILVLRGGSILVAWNPRPCPPGDERRFQIRTALSADGGKSWGNECVAFSAGTQWGEGCWEPAVIQLPDDGLRLFFANEAPYSASDEQEISMLRSDDGGLSWSKPETISFRAACRDGMPSPLWFDDQQCLVVAIEDNGSGALQPFIIRSEVGGGFPAPVDGASRNRQPALLAGLAPDVYAGAPWLRRLRTGETILSYQGTEGRRNEAHRFAVMKVAVGDHEARNFASVTVPFEIPAEGSGLWNSLAVLDDDTIVAITSTDAYTPGEVEVWMVKGHLVK